MAQAHKQTTPYCVGLTGTTASGKSTVAAEFARLGIDIVSADAIAKELTAKGEPALDAILHHFGPCILTQEGELNRSQMRDFIFNDDAQRQWLENLLHPLIRKQIKLKIQSSQSPYCIIEIPLLKDRKEYPYLNRVLLVEAGAKQQAMRLMARDNSNRKMALNILAAQVEKHCHRSLADDTLMNRGSLESLHQKVHALHELYIQLATTNVYGS